MRSGREDGRIREKKLRKVTALGLPVPGTLITGGGTLHFEEEN